MALSRCLVALFLASAVFASEVAGRSLLQDGVPAEAGMVEADAMDMTEADAMDTTEADAMDTAEADVLDMAEADATDMAEAAPVESDVPCSNPVTYRVRNDCDWSPEKFPTDYPPDPHWSPLCGTGHNDQYVMWRVGELASEGVKDVAELGSHSALQDEVNGCIEQGNCTSYVSYGCSPFSGTCVHEGGLDMNMDKPFVSLVSMIAPSPDWFTGIRDVRLCGEGGNWIKEYKKDLGVYDSGTDSGPSYSSLDEVTDPPVPVFAYNETDASNIFYNQAEMKLYPVCTITITLDEE